MFIRVKIKYLAAILGCILTLTSCDKDANNVEIVKVSGMYSGDIFAQLFMPDYETETLNTLINPNGQPSVAEDTIRGGEVQLNFSSDDSASFSLNHIPGMKFRIRFLLLGDDDDPGAVMPSFEGGLLAKYFMGIQNHYLDGEISKADFRQFSKAMEYVEDTISIHNLSVRPFSMLERGALVTTFDFEQNSVYVRTLFNAFDYSRKTNLSSVFRFAEEKFGSVMTDQEKALSRTLINGTHLSGTVTDAEAWTSMIYSNYRPYLEVTIDQATGLLDTLTLALFGDRKLDIYGNPLKDSDGNIIPTRTLIINMLYEGNISNMNSFEQVKE